MKPMPTIPILIIAVSPSYNSLCEFSRFPWFVPFFHVFRRCFVPKKCGPTHSGHLVAALWNRHGSSAPAPSDKFSYVQKCGKSPRTHARKSHGQWLRWNCFASRFVPNRN
jgi:hypothetical protein